MNDNYTYGLGGKRHTTPDRPCSPYENGENDVSDEIVQKSKDFLVDKIKEAYYGNDCMADVLTSTSSYPWLDEYEIDEEDINECQRRAFREIEEAITTIVTLPAGTYQVCGNIITRIED